MGRVSRQRIALIALTGLWELFVLHEALAGQPLEKVGAALNHAANAGRPAPSLRVPSERLDLRLPEVLAGSDSMQSFPVSARRKLFAAKNPSRFEADAAAPGAATPAPTVASGHIMSPMETMARNFRQQGLPVARLFENKDSLVHLGLNQKGKPGLWILHKLH